MDRDFSTRIGAHTANAKWHDESYTSNAHYIVTLTTTDLTTEDAPSHKRQVRASSTQQAFDIALAHLLSIQPEGETCEFCNKHGHESSECPYEFQEDNATTQER